MQWHKVCGAITSHNISTAGDECVIRYGSII